MDKKDVSALILVLAIPLWLIDMWICGYFYHIYKNQWQGDLIVTTGFALGFGWLFLCRGAWSILQDE